ncbi:MAG: 4-alpha-glucanotransferase [Acidobacteriia bacterium]|nr:4-alpha-glucanotransferase [Terriglobia bacterium]
MPPENFDQLLDSAAASCGIEGGYWDIWGRYHTTPADVKRSILTSKGMDAETGDGLTHALTERARREWQRLLPAAVVAAESKPRLLTLHVPAEGLDARARVSIQREDGGAWAFDLNLEDLAQTGSAEIDGRTWIRKEVQLPDDLPLGYHEVSVTVGGATATTRYIVTPDHAWIHPSLGQGGRAAGLGVSLYGVRSARNWGCGDFRDLLAVIDWVADGLNASFVALNPLHAIHNRQPFNTSPYSPNSIFYQNYLYLDVEGIEDFARCRRARHLRHDGGVCAAIEELRNSPFVDYERVGALKLRFLKLLFVAFLREWRTGSVRAADFQAFRTREGKLLEQFATYAALDEHLHRGHPEVWNWPQWPTEYRDPEGPSTLAFRKKHWRAVLFHQYLQWQIDRQLESAQQHARGRHLSIGLYHDLALATDSFGSDLWGYRSFFATGCRVGSPPDDFSPRGQDWGFPPPNSERHRDDGYRLFAESIRKNCRHGGALRIDHVMRLFRLFWIPDHCDASQGAYVRELSEDYVRLVALESVRHRVLVVGEDLGTVEPAIRETLARFGILSYRLFYFEKNGADFRGLDTYPQRALVSSTTHDLPTIAGYWTGADIEARHQAGMIDEEGRRNQIAARVHDKQKMLDALAGAGLLAEHLPRSAAEYPVLTRELHHAVAGFLARTPCQLWLINQEDLTLESAQQNLPGTTWQHPNWRRKMRFSLEELRSDPEALSLTATFREWIVNSKRANQPAE